MKIRESYICQRNKRAAVQWWRKRQSCGILYEQAGFESRDRLGFFSVQNCGESILAGRWVFSKERRIERCILFLLLSCFLSQLSKFVNCNINNEPRKIKSKKRQGEAQIKKVNETKIPLTSTESEASIISTYHPGTYKSGRSLGIPRSWKNRKLPSVLAFGGMPSVASL